jgi:hypothetical protein
MKRLRVLRLSDFVLEDCWFALCTFGTLSKMKPLDYPM